MSVRRHLILQVIQGSVETIQQRPLLLRKVKTRLSDCGVVDLQLSTFLLVLLLTFEDLLCYLSQYSLLIKNDLFVLYGDISIF